MIIWDSDKVYLKAMINNNNNNKNNDRVVLFSVYRKATSGYFVTRVFVLCAVTCN